MRDALEKYLGGPAGQFPDRYKNVSPLNHVSITSPPTISIYGIKDRLVPSEQAERLDRALAAAGVIHETCLLPGADHNFDANWGSLATQFAREKIKEFLKKNS
jgi:dipeptidyl aminopeptidase/acylaminoacyl peptidase